MPSSLNNPEQQARILSAESCVLSVDFPRSVVSYGFQIQQSKVLGRVTEGDHIIPIPTINVDAYLAAINDASVCIKRSSRLTIVVLENGVVAGSEGVDIALKHIRIIGEICLESVVVFAVSITEGIIMRQTMPGCPSHQ